MVIGCDVKKMLFFFRINLKKTSGEVCLSGNFKNEVKITQPYGSDY